MDTGKIFLGIALIAFSAVLVIHPASAAGCDIPGPVESGNIHLAESGSAAGSLQDTDYTPHSEMPAMYWNPTENLP